MFVDKEAYRRYRHSPRGKAQIAASQRTWRTSKKGKLFHKKKAAEKNNKLREFLHTLKSVPCADCGGRFPPVCMDFDHRVGTVKCFGITSSTNAVSIERLRAEIAKCDIVCANCHRLRTWNRKWQRSRDPDRPKSEPPTQPQQVLPLPGITP